LPPRSVLTIIKVIMAKKLPFALVYAAAVKQHLRAIETKFHALIQPEVEAQLLFEPAVETRNRKPLQRPIAFGAEWELRLGPGNRFRVFYQLTRKVGRFVSWPWASKYGTGC
jgi:hypothetical protein